MSSRILIPLAMIYSTIIIGFAVWWSGNYHQYAPMKGDESIYELMAIGAFTVFSLIFIKLLIPDVSWMFVMGMPLLICLLSVFITMFFIKGNTADSLKYYGLIHSMITIIVVRSQLKKVTSRSIPADLEGELGTPLRDIK